MPINITNKTKANPYRVGSKLHAIFEFISDGKPHSLRSITEGTCFAGASNKPLYLRRTASALRTIRSRPGLDVNFSGDWYRLIRRIKRL